VNLNGHTSGERNGICALKPAPVQLVQAHSTHTQTRLHLPSSHAPLAHVHIYYTHACELKIGCGDVQVFLAYPGTMGANYMDYNVVDKIVCPDEHRQFYTERMLYMPHCYQTNSFKDLYSKLLDDSTVPTRADHLLPAEPAFIFCNFCQLGRITSELFVTWMNILRRVPLSVLWLLR